MTTLQNILTVPYTVKTCTYHEPGASLIAQMVKNPPAMRGTWVQSLGWEDRSLGWEDRKRKGVLFLSFWQGPHSGAAKVLPALWESSQS